jgi:hypothetical protein
MIRGQVTILAKANCNELAFGSEVNLKDLDKKVIIIGKFLHEDGTKSYLVKDLEGVVKPIFENNICKNGKER